MEKLMKDIDKETDARGKSIDEKIKPLVQALWDAGYETQQSCEGHYGTTRKRVYPWVDLMSGRGSLETCVKEYNKNHQPWVVDGTFADRITYSLHIETPEIITPMDEISGVQWCKRLIPYLYYKYLTDFSINTPKGLTADQLKQAQTQIPILAAFIKEYHGA